MRRFGGAAVQSKGLKAQPPRWSLFGAWEPLVIAMKAYHKTSMCMNVLGAEVVIFRPHVDIVSQKQCVRAMMQPPVILLECMLIKGTCLFPPMTH